MNQGHNNEENINCKHSPIKCVEIVPSTNGASPAQSQSLKTNNLKDTDCQLTLSWILVNATDRKRINV